MDRLPWRENRKYHVHVAGPYKEAFNAAAHLDKPGLADHSYYRAAKYEGDTRAALKIVESTMNRLYLANMKIMLNMAAEQGVKNPIIVAPYKENSPNRLARTAAVYLGKELGLEVDHAIVERDGVSLKSLTKLERMFNSPDFDGSVQKNRWYIAVDDTISSGTTMAALRSHIVQGGGRFLCGCALASPDGQSTMLNASKDQINDISKLLSQNIIDWFERISHVALGGLTKVEADFLGKPQGRKELIGFAAKAGLFQS